MRKIIYIFLFLFSINTVNGANEDALLETVGFLSAGKAIITVYGLGTAYDAWSTEAYNDQEFENIILFYQNFIIATQEQLNELHKYGDLLYDDKNYIGSLIEVYDTMHEQARTSLKYSYTYKESDQNAYLNARSITINKMNLLFDLGWE